MPKAEERKRVNDGIPSDKVVCVLKKGEDWDRWMQAIRRFLLCFYCREVLERNGVNIYIYIYI